MNCFKRIFALATIFTLALPCFAMAQFPPVPDKAPALAVPSKSVPQAAPLASPQVQAPLASPQQSYAPQQSFAPVAQYDQPAVVLQAAPQVYAVQRQIAFAPVAYAACDTGCVAQQVVVQRNVIQRSFVGGHGVQRQLFVNRGLVGHEGFGQQRSKTVTKTVTKTRIGRGLFGR